MCTAVGHPVKEIQRIAFGPLRLGSLPRGQARQLTHAEAQRLRGLT
jgi:16S rRNA U516 pseudouridylate synthase RsuA-like enzyme